MSWACRIKTIRPASLAETKDLGSTSGKSPAAELSVSTTIPQCHGRTMEVFNIGCTTNLPPEFGQPLWLSRSNITASRHLLDLACHVVDARRERPFPQWLLFHDAAVRA